MSEPNNILPIDGDNRKAKLSEDRLMAYLEGKLSPAEQHEVEQWIADEGMESDAVEGLRNIGVSETKQSVSKLNHNLRKAIGNKRKRRQMYADRFTWIAIVIILLLAVVAYIVVRKSIR